MDLSEYVLGCTVHTTNCRTYELSSFKSVTIPQRDDPRLQPLAKRCEACRPLGMFRTSENEFLLCYNGPFDRDGWGRILTWVMPV